MIQTSLQKIAAKETRLCIGLMSGTSMDGIDTALVKISGSGLAARIALAGWMTVPYPRGLKKRLHEIIAADALPLSECSQMNFLLGELFAEAALKLLKQCGKPAESIDLIGSHGQTVWHNPAREKLYSRSIRSTLQLGEPAVIQARTGIVTVADFRVKDVALGGSGAPLVPYFDYLLFRSRTENRGLLNIGGIANITVIPARARQGQVFAFDTGPGNMLIDQLMTVLFGKNRDTDGRTAAKAPPNKSLLAHMMRHSYIRIPPPKSTGREMFGAQYAGRILSRAEKAGCTREEVISTVTEFTARSIARNYILHIEPECRINRIIMSGGGVHNRELVRRLENSLPGIPVETTDAHGIPSGIKEAVAFAVFASETVSGNAITLPRVTGAEKASISGKIVL